MEVTMEQYRAIQKDLRRRFSFVGWVLLGYYGIMNAAVFLAVFYEIIIRMMTAIASGNLDGMMEGVLDAVGSGWGYLLAVAVGLVVLLIWKKPRYFREEIGVKGRPMTVGSFLALLCIFLSGQTVYQIFATVLEWILNAFGLSMMEGLAQMSMVDTDSFSMFLYAGILAPISEEILFRGLIRRTLLPYGKRFAIVCSAFAFGVFHGNLMQSPYAFLVGLVLGYVATEYSIVWAMVLHMINNLVIADMLPRLTAGLPGNGSDLVIWAVILVFTLGVIAAMIIKRREIRAYFRQERVEGLYVKCFFSSPGMIVLMVLMGLSMAATFVMMLSLLS